MIIIGDKYIPYETIEQINSIDDIKSTKPNSTLFFDFNKEIMQYCMINDISYAVLISSLKESIYANNMNAKYIFCSDKISQNIQKIAENYLFDSKIIATIKSEDEIEKFAIDGIDGVIYDSMLK
ncbi:MAG: hypothetical protein U9Q20_01370 [Campylobacterota bacterium]|nr:hypothetical protein [Campylobacterota bacterium]